MTRRNIHEEAQFCADQMTGKTIESCTILYCREENYLRIKFTDGSSTKIHPAAFWADQATYLKIGTNK